MNALFIAMTRFVWWLLTFVPRRSALGAPGAPPESRAAKPAPGAPNTEATLDAVGNAVEQPSPESARSRAAKGDRPLNRALTERRGL